MIHESDAVLFASFAQGSEHILSNISINPFYFFTQQNLAESFQILLALKKIRIADCKTKKITSFRRIFRLSKLIAVNPIPSES